MNGMIGKYPVHMDDKNRLIVPAKLREELGDRFYVTIGVDGGYSCLTAYTEQGWQALGDKINSLPVSKRSGAASLFFINAVECQPDKQYRISLTGNLMKYAGIDRDAVIVGRAGQAEIWGAERFDQFEKENMTPEKLLESLEEIGL